MNKDYTKDQANQLINESSPYLLQHAYNPVDWRPWGPKALEKAQKENKLLIISIGYAACHWCHVMEHESFEDTTVARIMNEHFVPIKVDREERPDVDDIYMAAAQLLTGRGGWPLNAFALPDGRPIWAGTYFPRDNWIDILNQFVRLKEENYPRLVSSAEQLTSGIQSLDNMLINTAEEEWKEEELASFAQQLTKSIDQINGGRRGAPKFPMPNNFEFLLKFADRHDDRSAFEAVVVTLDDMAKGGIYDQIGGGFSRYSVDAVWKVPHFEKMLYDNGQLVSLYADAYKKTGSQLYRHIVVQSLEFIRREMTDAGGGFYSSLDADSEGEEGKFYVWTASEIDDALAGEKHLELFKDFYSVTEEGNWEKGTNILHRTLDLSELSKQHGLSEIEITDVISGLNQTLLQAREKRIRPGLDDKILTSWNGLMIRGYVDAFTAIGDPGYLESATKAAGFILNTQKESDHRLYRNYKDGKRAINAFLDDYALMIDALIALYEVTLEESWLQQARDLADYAIAHFFNKEKGMFNYTSDIDPPLIARKMETTDNVIPASNSVMARNLLKLGEFYYVESYTTLAHQMMKNVIVSIRTGNQSGFYTNWLQLMFDLVHPPFEVAVVGSEARDKIHTIQSRYTSNAAFLGSENESNLPLLENKYIEGRTLIYVCQNKVCKLPVTEVADALPLMGIRN